MYFLRQKDTKLDKSCFVNTCRIYWKIDVTKAATKMTSIEPRHDFGARDNDHVRVAT